VVAKHAHGDIAQIWSSTGFTFKESHSGDETFHKLMNEVQKDIKDADHHHHPTPMAKGALDDAQHLIDKARHLLEHQQVEKFRLTSSLHYHELESWVLRQVAGHKHGMSLTYTKLDQDVKEIEHNLGGSSHESYLEETIENMEAKLKEVECEDLASAQNKFHNFHSSWNAYIELMGLGQHLDHLEAGGGGEVVEESATKRLKIAIS